MDNIHRLERRYRLRPHEMYLPTLWDRLMNHAVYRRTEHPYEASVTIPQYKAIVLRDLAYLFNTTNREDPRRAWRKHLTEQANHKDHVPEDNRDGPWINPVERASWERYCKERESYYIDFDRYPYIETSVLNYGIPALAGRFASEDAYQFFAQNIIKAIRHFEPRIDHKSLDLRWQGNGVENYCRHNMIRFELYGRLILQPHPIEFTVLSSMDIETGRVNLQEVQKNNKKP